MTTPTDAELDALWEEAVLLGSVTRAVAKSFARAVLAKWGQPQEVAPDFYTACALHEGGGVGGWIALPGYSNETEHGVKHLVLDAARKEGYKGTAAGRLLDLGWEIRPVYLTPQPTPSPAPADPDGEAFRTAAHLGLTLRFYGGCAQSSMPGTPSAYEVVPGSDRAEAMRQAVAQAAEVIACGGEAQRLDQSSSAPAQPGQEGERDAEEHPAARRMRENFEREYGRHHPIASAIRHYYNTRKGYDDAWNRDRETPITFDDVSKAERDVFSAADRAARAAPQPATADALTFDDAKLLEKAVSDFEECGETDVHDADLRRFAAMGLLECVHYHVMPAAREAIDAALTAQREPKP